MKVSIIILDYEKSQRVMQNVEAILKQKVDFNYEIIIAVNQATNSKKEELLPLGNYKHANVKLLFNKENLGYTKGINEAVKRAEGRILFIINPDIIMQEENTMQILVNYLETNPQVGVVAPMQIEENSQKIAKTLRAFPKLHIQIARRTWLKHIPWLKEKVAYDEMQHLDWGKVQKVDWIQSSFWVVQKNFWEELEGLDENFFLFMSDPDFCRRAWEKRKEVVYLPITYVSADGKRCSEGGFLAFFQKWTLRQHLKDALKYHLKHLGKKHPRGN